MQMATAHYWPLHKTFSWGPLQSFSGKASAGWRTRQSPGTSVSISSLPHSRRAGLPFLCVCTWKHEAPSGGVGATGRPAISSGHSRLLSEHSVILDKAHMCCALMWGCELAATTHPSNLSSSSWCGHGHASETAKPFFLFRFNQADLWSEPISLSLPACIPQERQPHFTEGPPLAVCMIPRTQAERFSHCTVTSGSVRVGG